MNEQKLIDDIAVELRDILWNEASSGNQSAMAACPIECLGFALEWVKKQKGLPCKEHWFKEGQA